MNKYTRWPKTKKPPFKGGFFYVDYGLQEFEILSDITSIAAQFFFDT